MSEFALYFAPGTCARVSAISLYEAGVDFEPRLIKFMAGDHRSAGYLAQNPKGKVPLLLVAGEPLTENVAILSYLAQRFPSARLLPVGTDGLANARILADLAWCASGLHPLVTRLRLPQFFCDIDGAPERVWALAWQAMQPNFATIEQRLVHREWWYEEWSALDAYLSWVWFRVSGCAVDLTHYPRYAAHAERMGHRASVQKWLSVERSAEEELKAAGLQLQFPTLRRG